MKKLFITCYLFFNLTYSALATASETIMDVDPASIQNHPITLDQAIQELNAGDSTNRNVILNQIYNRFALPPQLANINLNKLFLSSTFEKFTPKDMTAFMLICGAQKISLSPEFVTEVNNRVAQNDPTSQVILAELHKCGWGGFSINLNKAVEWYQKAATQKDPKAQVMLALMHYHGKGVPENEVEAFKILQSAAEQKDPTSLSILIEMYNQKVIAQDKLLKVFQYFKNAAENGVEDTQLIADIQLVLGRMCYYGDGVSKDPFQAAEWLKKSAQCKPYCEYLLGLMYLSGEGIKEDQSKGIDHIRKAAQQGYPDAQRMLNKL